MYFGRPTLLIYLRRLKRQRLLRVLLLFIVVILFLTLCRRRVKNDNPTDDLHSATNLHLAKTAAYDFLHRAEFAQRTIKYFKDDRTNVKLLIEKCRVPPVFVSRLGEVGRCRLLAQLTRDSNGIPLWSTIPKILVVDLQNGLGNRFRALASAMEFAFLTQRILVVIWAPDAHIRARLSELLHSSVLSNLILIEEPVPWPLKESQLVAFASGADHVPSITDSHPAATSFMYYNFMQKDKGFQSVTNRKVTNTPSRHIYIKTAYQIEAKSMSNKLLNVFLQSMKPAPRVMQFVHSIEDQVGGAHIFRKLIGVHIRGRSIIDDNNDIDSECEYSLEGAQLTNRWRKMSTTRQFIPEMKRIQYQWSAIVRSEGLSSKSLPTPQRGDDETNLDEDLVDIIPVDVAQIPKFFVCVDSVHIFEELSKQFPKNSLISLPRKCDDRGAECMIYAFADLVLLSRTGAMLASGWSSFSEVALGMRVRPNGMHPSSNAGYYVRMSGYDFGKPPYWEKLAFRARLLLKKWSRSRDSERGVSQEDQLKLCNQKYSKSTVK